MDVMLLLEICGPVVTLVLIGTSGILTAITLYLVLSARRQDWVAAFLPVTFLPFYLSLVPAITGTLSAIGSHLGNVDSPSIEPGLLMQMNLLPILFGLLCTSVPAMAAAVGRCVLLYGETYPEDASE